MIPSLDTPTEILGQGSSALGENESKVKEGYNPVDVHILLY
jgi:hypothetical protein